MKRFTPIFTLALILLFVGFSFAGTAKIHVMGVSDRTIANDTTGFFKSTASGLPNVGMGETIYLEANPGDTAVTVWSWTLQGPDGSTAALSADNVAKVKFAPDMKGTFTVTLTTTSDTGASAPATLKVNSAFFVGMGGIIDGDNTPPHCIACHSGQRDNNYNEFLGTKHATAFQRKIADSTGHFSKNCIKCHTVGYNTDASAVNNGFDDVSATEGWQFPAKLQPGNWDSMKVNYPNSSELAGIQCENCHGPGESHQGNVADNRISRSLEVGVCAKCHDSGTHHIVPFQWQQSLHSHPVNETGRVGCERCHTGDGFVDYTEGIVDTLRRHSLAQITCATCHDPHDASNPHQLRTVEPYTLENAVVVDAGLGTLCINCHHSRQNVNTVIKDGAGNNRFGPHHGPQGDMIFGTGGYQYGQEMPSGAHSHIENVCVGCHMAPTPADTLPGANTVGGHSFAVKSEDGVENVTTCKTCHGDIESFDDIKAGGDWDKNGKVESVPVEIAGMLDILGMKLPPLGDPQVTITKDYSINQLRAAYNYQFVKEDKSMGIHNAAYAHALLQAAIDDPLLGVTVADDHVPMKYALGSAYPNPFNPSTTFEYSVAKNGLVNIAVFDMTGRSVETIVNSDHKAGTYRASVTMANHASGVYMIRMNAGTFTATKKIVLVK